MNCVTQLAELVLTRNFFMFENDFFLQVRGAAMGSRMAPNYVGLFMGLFEQDQVFALTNPFLPHIRLWRRYVDDIFLLWTGNQQELNEFFQWINTCNRSLKFTMSSNIKEINYLDILIKREEKGFQTSVYKNPTDRNALLRADSFHPPALKRSLPISQYNRIRRLCSDDTDYEHQVDLLDMRFKERCYPQD